MRLFPGLRGGIALAFALAVAAACSKTPQYYDDLHTGGMSSTGTGGTGSRACANVGDCGVADTECAHPVCESGRCAMTFAPMGTALMAQVPGDCKTAICDGMGHVTSSADPMDADDGNPCTDDSCNGSTPVHAPSAGGSPCGENGHLMCDGMGACVGCKTDGQCGAGGACFTWVCTNQQCQQQFTPAGAGNPGGDTPGDCQHNVCDGMGGISTVVDPSDHPPDPNACLAGICNGGSPSTQPKPAGTACPGGVCDGNGNCGQCLADADCGAPTACATPVCVANHCSATYAPYGAANPPQAPHDCRTQICDGSGGVTSVPDDSDVPPNPDACNIASCSGGNAVTNPVQIPPTNDPCKVNSCDPTQGIVTGNVADGTACGGCSACFGGSCTDPCPAMGCICNGIFCDCGGGG